MGSSLIKKYNKPGPRYTSYPTVPHWSNTITEQNWKEAVFETFTISNKTSGISIYIHLPYCESLCTYCGCNMRVSKNHKVEEPYIDALIKEWNLYLDVFKERPNIKEIHLGGGTPTFFSAQNLEKLILGITQFADIAPNYEFSFEAHPKNTSKEHLQTLFNLGFRRLSLGIQDFDPKVQEVINRPQPYEIVEEVVNNARKIGYTSINFDLIYGLPLQTLNSVTDTITKVKQLKPDRIAFYSYAHVPWIKGNGQRGFNDSDLPSADLKRKQYELGKQLLGQVGYEEIGMDHFALPTDGLHKSMLDGNLHRNFMGYTASKTQAMIGLGVSSISDSWYGFSQNVKDIESYYKLLEEDTIPVYRGHILNEEDLKIRRHILNLMCQFKTSWHSDDLYFTELPDSLILLKEMEKDGLLQIGNKTIEVTSKGQPFVRNICMAFDVLLQRKQPDSQLFSMTV